MPAIERTSQPWDDFGAGDALFADPTQEAPERPDSIFVTPGFNPAADTVFDPPEPFGSGGFFDPGGRDPRPADFGGGIFSDIGSVGPDVGLIRIITGGIADSLKDFDLGNLINNPIVRIIADGILNDNGENPPQPETPDDIAPVIDPGVIDPGPGDIIDLTPGGDDGIDDGDAGEFGEEKPDIDEPEPGEEDMAGDPFSIGGGVSTGATRSETISEQGAEASSLSGGSAIAGSAERVAFEDVFARLFGGAENAAAGLDPSLLTETSNQLFSGGLGFLDQLSGGADTEFLEGTVRGDDDILNQQISGLGEDIGQFFREQVLTGITSESVAGGGLGGARQGLAEGGAASAAGREFQRGATELRAADRAQRIDAAGRLGETRVSGAEAGLGGLEGLAGIADRGFGAGLEPFERLAALLGNQTVLGTSASESVDFASALSSSFGRSKSIADSETEAKKFNLGF